MLTPSAGRDELAEITVGQLLIRYAETLAGLRHRRLVRTNNAPTGDLAEYCAAIVYDGLVTRPRGPSALLSSREPGWSKRRADAPGPPSHTA